jgi:hypothetical protein
MYKTFSLFVGLMAVFAMASAQGADCASALGTQPVRKASLVNPETGHTFDVYKATGITWDQASCFVDGLPAVGSATTRAHLATITSSSENQWIVELLLRPVLEHFEGGRTQVWVGGFRHAGVWRWVNGEGPFGPFPDMNGGTEYTNWAPNEPNNSGGIENHLTLGRFSTDLSGWNDEGAAVGSIGGFIVEYDTPLVLGECDGITTKACTTVQGQTLTFPSGSFEAGDSINFTAFEFTDPRIDPATGKCSVNRGPLSLFTDAAFGGNATLTIPEYLCGSPRFLVVKVDATLLDIRKGAVAVVNDTDEVLPDNDFACFDPILGSLKTDDPRYSADPQHQDVVVWQSTDPRMMLEGPPGPPPSVGVGPSAGIYFGAATEATNGCGSTRAKVRTGSYFVVGMHIDFNRSFPLDQAALYEDFYKLTQYKLGLLLTSVRNARSFGAIKNPDGQAMESQVRNAINAMNAGNPASALSSMRQFLKKVNDSKYFFPNDVTAKYNYNGDHLMRGENIAFTLRAKVIPYKP